MFAVIHLLTCANNQVSVVEETSEGEQGKGIRSAVRPLILLAQIIDVGFCWTAGKFLRISVVPASLGCYFAVPA